jgi:uncharacterized RDD family membrane protein YckC
MATATTRPNPIPMDTTVQLVTPERIAFQYPLAGPFHRACSYLIDLLVLIGLTLAGWFVSTVITLGTSASMGLFLIGFFVLYQFYGALCEGLFNGQTAGKRALGLRVVSTEGVPIGGGQAVLRNLLWAFDGIWPFAYLPALACMLLTGRFQRLGDLAAGTMVIVERGPRAVGVARIQDRDSDAVLPLLPAKIAAGSQLSRVLSDYVKRRGRFSRPRREEMVDFLVRPLRRRYGLPPTVSGDAVLCALYRRVFLGD